VNAVPDKKIKRGHAGEPRNATRLPALLAAGSVLLAGTASALELGELQLESSLGQPLRASIAYALGPNEQLSAYCIYVRPGNAGFPGVTDATASLANGRVLLSSRTALREPMVNLQLTVDCANAAHLRRDYLLMLDPATLAPLRATAAINEDVAEQPEARPAVTAATPRRDTERRARSAPRPTTPIESGRHYSVRPGDTLSDIASRIPDRDIGLWPAVEALFAANPQAFIGGDPNRLKAGATLIIPASLGTAQAAQDPAPAAQPLARTYAGAQDARPAASLAAEAAPAELAAAADPVSVNDSATASDDISPFVVPDIAARPDVETSVETTVDTGAAPARTAVTAPETNIEHAPVPVVGNRVGADDIDRPAPLSWLMWLGGTGIAIILGLLLFGRPLRERIGNVFAAPEPRRRRTDHGEAAEDSFVMDDLRNTLSRAGLSTLDADLEDGSGFDSSPDMDVAQDFSFASSGAYGKDARLDLEFDERAAREPQPQPTDMMPTPAVAETVIVESEILPGSEDSITGYELSMVVDATQQNFDEADASVRDLHAVETTSMEDTGVMETGSYILNEAEYRLIEQDYEDELTATQVLNEEMERAARELTARLKSDELTASEPNLGDMDAVTAKMVAADEAAADSAQDSMARDLESMAESTSNMPLKNPAVNDDLDDTDVTVEMPADQNEVTVEMKTGSARVTRRKAKVS
jgi:hypothetical protein